MDVGGEEAGNDTVEQISPLSRALFGKYGDTDHIFATCECHHIRSIYTIDAIWQLLHIKITCFP